MRDLKNSCVSAEVLTDIEESLEERLSDYRLAHSRSVADYAVKLAKIYGVNPDKAYVAGLVHDWDKDLDATTLENLARELGFGCDARLDQLVGILHAPVGAHSVHERYPQISGDIIDAIARHTVAAPSMTDLDMIIYIADMLEPLRDKDHIDRLRKHVGKLTLPELYRMCYRASLVYLIEKKRYVYPEAIEIYNGMVASEHEASSIKESLTGEQGGRSSSSERGSA